MKKQAHWNEYLVGSNKLIGMNNLEWITCRFKPRPSSVIFPLHLCGPFSIFTAATSHLPSIEQKAPLLFLALFSFFFKLLRASLLDFFIKVLVILLYKSLHLLPIVWMLRPQKGIYCWHLTPPSSLAVSLSNSKQAHHMPQGQALFFLSLDQLTADSRPSINLFNLETD